MVAYRIREATDADSEAIDEINRQSWSGEITTHELLEGRHGSLNGREWSEHITNAVAAHLALPDVTTFVAEWDDGEVIGFASAQISRQPHSEMGTVSYNAVHPDFRRQGIGTALIKHVMAYLKVQGARVLTVVTLESDDAACQLYERLDFKQLTSLNYYSKDC